MTGIGHEHVRVGVGEVAAVDLHDIAVDGRSGVLWGLDSPQLNANFAVIQVGESIDEHVNDEVDQLLIVVNGTGQVVIDTAVFELKPDSVVLVPRGAVRMLRSLTGLAYYSVHVRRAGLTVG